MEIGRGLISSANPIKRISREHKPIIFILSETEEENSGNK